jgi:hypothetical protein
MLRAVGQLDQFAKDTLALETASVTHGGAAWQLAPELNMSEVRLDGLLLVSSPPATSTSVRRTSGLSGGPPATRIARR